MERPYIDIEITGRFEDAEALSTQSGADEAAQADDFEVTVSSGFGGERLVNLLAWGKSAVVPLRDFLNRLTGSQTVSGIKVTRDGVKVANAGAMSPDEMKAFILDVLDRLERD